MFSSNQGRRGGLPDLPPVRSNLAGRQADDDNANSLPAFPDSPSHNDFAQAAIKDAVGGAGGIGNPPEGIKDVKIVEMEEWNPGSIETPDDFMESKALSEPEPESEPEVEAKPIAPPPPPKQRVEAPMRGGVGNKDVFVKIEQFHMAKKSLFDLKDKLDEIDELINKIRETKLREEQEITAWERDIAHAKLRIKEVSENIFEKVE